MHLSRKTNKIKQTLILCVTSGSLNYCLKNNVQPRAVNQLLLLSLLKITIINAYKLIMISQAVATKLLLL